MRGKRPASPAAWHRPASSHVKGGQAETMATLAQTIDVWCPRTGNPRGGRFSLARATAVSNEKSDVLSGRGAVEGQGLPLAGEGMAFALSIGVTLRRLCGRCLS